MNKVKYRFNCPTHEAFIESKKFSFFHTGGHIRDKSHTAVFQDAMHFIGIYFQPPIISKVSENVRNEGLMCSLKNVQLNKHAIYLPRELVVFTYANEKIAYFSHQNPLLVSTG